VELNFELTRIILDEIDLSRRAPFRFRLILPGESEESIEDEELKRSVSDLGIAEPPILIKRSELSEILEGAGEESSAAGRPKNANLGFTSPNVSGDSGSDLDGKGNIFLLSGFRRCAAASAGGISETEAILISGFKEASEVVDVWLEAARHGATLSEVEKAILVVKVVELLGSKWRGHTERLGISYGRRLSAEYIDRLKELLAMDKGLLLACHRGVIRAEELLKLADHPALDTGLLVGLLARRGASARERSEIIRLATLLAGREPDELHRFLEKYGDESGTYGPRSLRPVDELKEILYPTFSRDTKRFEEIVSNMRLPTFIDLSPPENLEGTAFTLRAKIRREEDLALVIAKLESALKRGEIQRLLDILKGK